MSLDKYTTEAAKFGNEIETLSATVAPRVRARYQEIMKDSSQRDKRLMSWFIIKAEESTYRPAGFWEEVAKLALLPFEKLVALPLNKRGEIWDNAFALMSVVALEQALAEVDVSRQSMMAGVGDADAFKRNVGVPTLAEAREGKNDIREKTKAIRDGNKKQDINGVATG